LLCTADTSGLQKGAAKARTEVLSVAATVEQARSKMGGLLAGLGAALGVGSLTAWVKGSMDAINSTRVLGERLGTSSEALSRLGYAAKIADVDSETLAGSLSKMQRNLAEVAMTGEGKAGTVLEKFGLDAAELANQDPVATFHQLLGVLEQIPNPAERAKTAMDMFGKQSQGILNLALQGSEGLAQMEAEADRLGITFTDLDAAKVDEADDAMTKIWETVAATGRTLAVELAPWITEVATRFMGWVKDATQGSSYIAQGLDWITTGVGYAADGVQLLTVAWYGVKGALEAVLSGWLYMIDKAIKGVTALLNLLPGVHIEATNFVGDMAKYMDGAAQADFAKAKMTWSKDWAHNAVRDLVDDVKTGANGRAVEAVKTAKKFRGTGGDDEIEMSGKKSAAIKAMTMGSAEAANTILATKFGAGQGKDLPAVAGNTKRTADGIEQMLGELSRLSGLDQAEIIDNFS
jgi:hypothetical protein